MPVCTNCSALLPSITALDLHIKLHHNGTLKVFKCAEKNCFRTLKGWTEFRRHLIFAHKYPVHAPKCTKERVQGVFSDSKNESPDMMDVVCDSSNDDFGTEESPVPSIQTLFQLESFVHTLALQLVAKLYTSRSVPRKYVQEQIEMTENFLSSVFEAIQSFLLCTQKKSNEFETDASAAFETVLKPFQFALSTEYLRLKALEETGSFIHAKDVVVGDRLDDVLYQGRIIQDITAVKAKFVPIRETLSQFLSLPGALSSILDYTDYLKIEQESGIISNFMQGELWQKKMENFPGKTVLPLHIFYDDFECNNALGSHAGVQKLGGVYFSLPCLPPEYRSTLDNIFLTLLFHASDRKNVEEGNKSIFKILVEELNFLQTTGIEVELNGKGKTIYFSLGLVLGDNEGLNSALGFMGGFNANYFCRFCKVYKNDSDNNNYVTDSLLRSEEGYNEDVALGNPSQTGVQENSIWNLVFFFHVVMNYGVDIMHDLLEGVCKYDMGHILHYYIIEKKYFTVHQLNAKILSFNYTSNGFKNKIPSLSQRDVSERRIPMSASEMWTFVLLFPMLIGDLLTVNANDVVWNFYLILREIMDICFAKSVQIESAAALNDLVSKHNALYIKIFKDKLKPKHHFMTHYGFIMKMSGPLTHLSSMRFESKHRDLKTIAKSTLSRVNLCHTIVMKELLCFCCRLICKQGLGERCDFGSGDKLESIHHYDNYYTVRDSWPKTSFSGPCLMVPWVRIKGITYRLGSIVSLTNDTENLPTFGKVITIFISEKEEVRFVCEVMYTIRFSEKRHSYKVTTSGKLCSYGVSELVSPFLNVFHRLGSGKSYVTVRYAL